MSTWRITPDGKNTKYTELLYYFYKITCFLVYSEIFWTSFRNRMGQIWVQTSLVMAQQVVLLLHSSGVPGLILRLTVWVEFCLFLLVFFF